MVGIEILWFKKKGCRSIWTRGLGFPLPRHATRLRGLAGSVEGRAGEGGPDAPTGSEPATLLFFCPPCKPDRSDDWADVWVTPATGVRPRRTGPGGLYRCEILMRDTRNVAHCLLTQNGRSWKPPCSKAERSCRDSNLASSRFRDSFGWGFFSACEVVRLRRGGSAESEAPVVSRRALCWPACPLRARGRIQAPMGPTVRLAPTWCARGRADGALWVCRRPSLGALWRFSLLNSVTTQVRYASAKSALWSVQG